MPENLRESSHYNYQVLESVTCILLEVQSEFNVAQINARDCNISEIVPEFIDGITETKQEKGN